MLEDNLFWVKSCISNTLTESEFTWVHSSISQGLYLCFKAQPQNWCWNGSEDSVSGLMITVTWPSVPTWSAEIRLENSKSFWCCLNILAARIELTSTEGELNEWVLGFSVSLYQIRGSTSFQSTIPITVHWLENNTMAHLYDRTYRIKWAVASLLPAIAMPCLGENKGLAEWKPSTCSWLFFSAQQAWP